MDGHATNLAMCRELGCSTNVMQPKPYFAHPTTGSNVYVLYDACHMLKLARNLIHAYKQLQSSDGVIQWSYVNHLQDVQDVSGLKLANRLSQRHIDFQRQKMKVSLAALTLSSSVATALQCLLETDHTKFIGCEPTVQFIKVFLHSYIAVITFTINLSLVVS